MAFTAFVAGVSLLIYTTALVVIIAVAGAGSAVIPWKDVFWTDYQTTDSFRSYLSDRLSVLVRSAADPEGADPMTPEDTDLLYVVTAGDAVRFANTDELRPNQLPDGYNFLLTYDGESVRVYKDGREISDSFQVALPAKTDADVSVSLAAAEHPTEYLSGDYDSFSYLLDDLRQIRAFVIWLLIVPALAGVALTVWSIVWHRYKVRADQAIAWFTGRVWLEIKILLLIPFLWVCALAFMCLLAVVTNQVLTYGVLRYASVPLALWWFYLYVNDIRYNFGHITGRSLCAGLAGLLRRQLLRRPAAQRTERRMIWQFAACLPFFLFCALSVPYLLNHWFAYGIRPILLLLICAAGVALIALQVWLIRENKQSAAELDDLLGRIEAAGAARGGDGRARVTVVGHFPHVDRIAEYADLTVLERNCTQALDTPDPACEYVLPKSDYTFITGVTIINKTAPRLLDLTKYGTTVMVGPSVVMSPFLFDWGVEMLAGSVVADPDKARFAVMNGAGQFFGEALQMMSITRPGA